MSEDNDISNIATIDSLSGKSVSIQSYYSDSETIEIDDENASLLRHHDPSNNRNKKENNEKLGLILMALSALLFSIMSLCAKIVNKKYPFFQSVLILSIVQMLGSYIGCNLARISSWGYPQQYLEMVCRGTFGALAITLYFSGLTYLTLGDNTAIFFTTPAFITIIAWILLGDKLTVFDSLISLFSILGVLLVSKPQFLFIRDSNNDSSDNNDNSNDNHNNNSIYFLLPLIGAFMAAFAYVMIRDIGKEIHYLIHRFYFGVVSTAISACSLFIFKIQDPVLPESLFDWIIYGFIGISAFLGQYLLHQGIQHCTSGSGTLLRNLDVVFSFIFGMIFFGEIPGWNSILGSLMIVGSNLMMGFKQYLQKMKEKIEPSLQNIFVSLEE